MTDRSGLQRREDGSDTTMYRPGPDGGLVASPERTVDYRERLRSRRWGAAPLENPEAERTDPRIAVGFIVALSAGTLVLLVLGYGTGFWG